jgi:CTP:phosphocholine cytidylyltransferase-like protein
MMKKAANKRYFNGAWQQYNTMLIMYAANEKLKKCIILRSCLSLNVSTQV